MMHTCINICGVKSRCVLKTTHERILKGGQDIAFNGIKKILHVTFSVRTYVQTYFRTTWDNRIYEIRLLSQACLLPIFSGSINYFFCPLAKHCFAKGDPETGVYYLLRSCPITGILLIKEITKEGKETTIFGKCSYLVLSMFVSAPRSVRPRKPSFLRFSPWNKSDCCHL